MGDRDRGQAAARLDGGADLVVEDGKAAVRRSAERYLRAIGAAET